MYFWMSNSPSAFLCSVPVDLRMQVAIPLVGQLFLLYYKFVGLGPGILTNTGHLPADSHPGCPTSNLETMVSDFLCNVEVWPGSTNRGELIVTFLVQRLEPIRKFNESFAVGIKYGFPIINVFPVGRLNKRVEEVLVCRIKWMVYFEATTTLCQGTADVNV